MSELVIANKSDLVTVADAIREKAGIEDGLAFPEGFAEAIAAIEAGGSGGAVVYGTVTAAADCGAFIIQHNLGVVPNFAMFATDSKALSGMLGWATISGEAIQIGTSTLFQIGINKGSSNSVGCGFRNVTLESNDLGLAGNPVNVTTVRGATTSAITLACGFHETFGMFPAGAKYHYVVGRY